MRTFLSRYRLVENDIAPEKAKPFAIAVGEWSHQLRAGARARNSFTVAQFVAPIAAATATVLAAFSSTSAWAIIPSAITTVAASLLAAFGLREIWQVRRRLRHELAQEIVDFVMGYRAYRKLALDEQIDRLMDKVSEVSMAAAQSK